MNPGFLRNDKAVSPVIGFALILAIIVSTLGYMQTYYVPVWNAETESQHFEDVYQDMVLFSSNIESAAISGIPRTSGIRLGLTYPKRGIFFNPRNTLFGNLGIEPNVYVNVTYTTNSNTVITKSYRSSTIKYELPGAHPYLIYEHGLIIRDFSIFGRPNATASSNTLIVGDNINIPFLILNGSGFSTISVEPGIIPIYPVELTSKNDRVEYFKCANITIDTNYPDVWTRILKNTNTSKTTAYVRKDGPGYKIIINTSAGEEIDLPDERIQATQAGRLYAGTAMVKATGELTSLKGGGEEIMNQGTIWNDVPVPADVSKIIVTNISYVDSNILKYNTINFNIADESGNYWLVKIDFDFSVVPKVKAIKLRTSYGFSAATGTYLNNFINFNNNSMINLFDITNFNVDTGGYNKSNISLPNTLTSTLVGNYNGPLDSSGDSQNSVLNYRLIIE